MVFHVLWTKNVYIPTQSVIVEHVVALETHTLMDQSVWRVSYIFHSQSFRFCMHFFYLSDLNRSVLRSIIAATVLIDF